MPPQYKQKYCSKWERDPELKGWVRAVPGDPFHAFCIYCKVTLNAKKKDLQDHASRKKHLDSAAAHVSGKNDYPKITDKLKPTKTNHQKIVDLALTAFVAEHTSVRTIDHLGELLKNVSGTDGDNPFNSLKLHRTKCSGLIREVLAPALHEEVVADIKSSEAYFSIVLDECTDISDSKWVGMIVRYYSTRKMDIVDTLYRLYPLDGATADDLANAIFSALKSDKLEIDHLLGIGVDGASVNVGCNHSVSKLLKEKVPHLVVVKCLCHSLHLAASKASVTLPRHLDFMVRESYNWFAHSTKRQQKYRHIYETINFSSTPLKLLRPCETRWLSIKEAIDRVLDQWEELKLLFSIAKDEERDYGAEQLYILFCNKVNKVYMLFVQKMLIEATTLNKMFQSEIIDQSKLFTCFFDYYLSLLKMLVVPTQMERVTKENMFVFDFEQFLMPVSAIYFGFNFEQELQKLSLSAEDVKCVKERCKIFAVTLAKEVRCRLPENARTLLQLSSLNPENAISKIHSSIVPLAAAFQTIFGSVDCCQNQWDRLPYVSLKELNMDSTVAFWTSVSKITDAAGARQFPHISKLALSLLSLPFSNATVERLFSILNNVKCKVRNRMSLKTCEAILITKYGLKFRGETCSNFKPSKVMLQRFVSDIVYSNQENQENLDDLLTVLNE